MNINRKIYTTIFVWVVISFVSFYFVFSYFANGLMQLQSSHMDQINQNNDLSQQINALHSMQADLDQLAKSPVTPDNFFTSDVQLVQEIQHIESVANSTNNNLKISITGTADQAQSYPSSSNLYAVPYTITLVGSFPATVNFLHYFENSYFISPVTTIDISGDGAAGGSGSAVKTTILATFFIHKN